MRVRGMDVNFPRSCISPIITLKQPASARGLEKGGKSFSRPLLGAAACFFILSKIYENFCFLLPHFRLLDRLPVLPGIWYFWIGLTGFRTTARWEVVFLN